MGWLNHVMGWLIFKCPLPKYNISYKCHKDKVMKQIQIQVVMTTLNSVNGSSRTEIQEV